MWLALDCRARPHGVDSAPAFFYDQPISAPVSAGDSRAMAKRVKTRTTMTASGAKRRMGTAPARSTPASSARPTSASAPARGAVASVLTGMRDIGGQVGHVAATVVRGSIRAAGQIGADVGRLAVTVADGAFETADRLAAAAGLVASRPGDPGHAKGPPRREPWAPASSRERDAAAPELPASHDAYARQPTSEPAPAARKPLARSAPRTQKRQPAKRRRRRSA